MNKIQIALGDWSNDGHGMGEHFTYETNKDIKAIREAYFNATKKFGCAFPEEVCADYEQTYVNKDEIVYADLKSKGFTFKNCDEDEDRIYPYEDGMLQLTEWFLKQGDPELKLKRVDEGLPTLYFYGYDDKKRHIGQIGYGIYGH